MGIIILLNECKITYPVFRARRINPFLLLIISHFLPGRIFAASVAPPGNKRAPFAGLLLSKLKMLISELEQAP